MKTSTTQSLKPLAATFFLSGCWDLFAAFMYIFMIGTGRKYSVPPMDPFYAVFLGSFFLCFVYLQFLSAFNIRHYAFIVGCLFFGRIFYVVQLFAWMYFKGFPDTFWFTGIIDLTLALSYLWFARMGGLQLKWLFIPRPG
jgi:hypothetical protein